MLAADTGNVSLTGGTASFGNATVSAGKLVTLTGATLTGSAAGNYNLTSVGTTTAAITAATLVVSADNKTKTSGAADPAFTTSYVGFVNSETPAVLGGTLNIVAPGPVILPLARADTTNIVITWTAVSNATYRVQYQSVLDAANWNDLTGDVIASAGTASKTDIMTTTNRFYRVQARP